MSTGDTIRESLKKPAVRWTLAAAGAFFAALLIFHAGIVVGMHRAHGGAMGEERSGFFFTPFGAFGVPHGFVEDGHGAVGTVSAIALPTLTVESRDGSLKTVLLSASTSVDTAAGAGTPSDIAAGSFVVIVGKPDASGTINAEVVRILPPMPTSTRPKR